MQKLIVRRNDGGKFLVELVGAHDVGGNIECIVSLSREEMRQSSDLTQRRVVLQEAKRLARAFYSELERAI